MKKTFLLITFSLNCLYLLFSQNGNTENWEPLENKNEILLNSLNKNDILYKLFKSDSYVNNGETILWQPNTNLKFGEYALSTDEKGNAGTTIDTIIYLNTNTTALAILRTEGSHGSLAGTCSDIIGLALFSKTEKNDWQLNNFDIQLTHICHLVNYKIENFIIDNKGNTSCLNIESTITGSGGRTSNITDIIPLNLNENSNFKKLASYTNFESDDVIIKGELTNKLKFIKEGNIYIPYLYKTHKKFNLDKLMQFDDSENQNSPKNLKVIKHNEQLRKNAVTIKKVEKLKFDRIKGLYTNQ